MSAGQILIRIYHVTGFVSVCYRLFWSQQGREIKGSVNVLAICIGAHPKDYSNIKTTVT